jgi:hypothetical protein
MGKRGAKDEEPRFDGVLGPFQGIGLPSVRTLSDEYRDTPEPKDSDRVPPPEPPGLVRRIVDHLDKPHGHGDTSDK